MNPDQDPAHNIQRTSRGSAKRKMGYFESHANFVGHAPRGGQDDDVEASHAVAVADERHSKKITLFDMRYKTAPVENRGGWEVKPMENFKQKIFLEPDERNGNQLTFEASLKNAQAVDDDLQAVCFFASALNAVNGRLGDFAKEALRSISIELDIKKFPSQSEEVLIEPELAFDFNAREIFGVLGVCFFLLFKNVTEDNYTGFMTRRVQALIGKIGISQKRKKEMAKLFTVKKATVIREMLGGHLPLKQAVLTFCCANSESDDAIGMMSRYVKHILSWNEMTLYQFIYNTLCVPNSPVLADLAIQDEVCQFTLTLNSILRSREPQFFRYFCSDAEEELLIRSRINILGQVATMLKRGITAGSTVQRFKSPIEKESVLVNRLVALHKAYVRNYTSTDHPLPRFLLNKPSFEELDIEEGVIENDR